MISKKDMIEHILGLMHYIGITIEDLRQYEDYGPYDEDDEEKEFVCEYGSPEDDDSFGGMKVNEDFFQRHKDPSGLSTEVSGDVADDDFGGRE